ADHHLDRPAERTQPYGRARGAVAMRAGAVDDEERLRRPRVHSRGRDLAVRQAERPADVTLAEVLGAAHIEQNESGWVRGKSLVDVPAIGLQPKQPLEMRKRLAARRRRDGSDRIRHELSPEVSAQPDGGGGR